jgi:TIR domain
MNPEPPTSVFASYSRTDARLVRQLLGLFAAIDVPVFRDEQSIRPGQKWRIEIDAALEQCQTILVFWCGHAAESSEVRSEYERAISLGKRVVPVLIDDSALPPDLGQYQGVDLRMTFSEHHELFIDVLDPPRPRHFGRDHLRRPPKHESREEGDWRQQYLENLENPQVIAIVHHDIERASQRLESALNSIFSQ